MNINNFSSLNLKPTMVENLNKLGYTTMTPIQQSALPVILNNQDIIAQAKTGSGKTAAFGIGILTKLNVKKFRIQSMVLCPTRELADQVAKELRNIAKFEHNIKILTLCGGVAFGPQLGSLSHHAHIIVGTPGRILKHLDKSSLSLEDLDVLVLDEADRMLDMGFIEDIEKIISFTSKDKQTLLFSATYPDEILTLSKSIQQNAINIKTEAIEVKNEIKELFYNTDKFSKVKTIINIFATFMPENIIIFCNTKIACDELADELNKNNIDALALHGDMEQYDRNDVLVQFSNSSCRVLVATDVAARGLDIKELSMVINFDEPNSDEIYTHRIGRTGRAGAKGLAITFLDSYEDRCSSLDKLVLKNNFEMPSKFITLVIEGGKKDKLRKGDILGALTGDIRLDGKNIGKIDIYDRQSYVAIDANFIDETHKKLQKSKIKKRKFSSWIL